MSTIPANRWNGNRLDFTRYGNVPRLSFPTKKEPSLLDDEREDGTDSLLDMGGMGGLGDRDAPGRGGSAGSGISLSSLAPDRAGAASMAGGAAGGLVGGPFAGLAGGLMGGLAGGMGPARAGLSTAGGLLGMLGGPVTAALGSMIGGAIGSRIDPMSDRALAEMTKGDFGVPEAPMYEGPMTLHPDVPGAGLGGIGAGATGAMGQLADGTSVGYGALGTPSSYGFSDLGSGSDSGSSSKIVCTAMCHAYGFGSFRQTLWLAQSRTLAPEYQRGYHLIFRPLVERAYRENGPVWLRSVLEHIARHRTADIWQQKRGRRDWIGAAERFVLEPLCYAVGRLVRLKRCATEALDALNFRRLRRNLLRR